MPPPKSKTKPPPRPATPKPAPRPAVRPAARPAGPEPAPRPPATKPAFHKSVPVAPPKIAHERLPPIPKGRGPLKPVQTRLTPLTGRPVQPKRKAIRPKGAPRPITNPPTFIKSKPARLQRKPVTQPKRKPQTKPAFVNRGSAASGDPKVIMYQTARSRHVSFAVLRALFLIGRAENDWNVNTCNSSGHCGIFQLDGDWQRRHDYRDVAYWTNFAIDHGFYGYGGLAHIDATHPGWPIGDIVQACQGAGPTFSAAAAYYQSRLAQSDADLRAVAGSGAAAAPTVRVQKYYNPLAHARVRAERIDQGVDYAGTGYLVAIADGVVTMVSGQAWQPYGNYLEYKITTPGPLENVYIYYAEGINPVVRDNERIRAGSRLCDLIPGWRYGIEIGFAAGYGAESYYRYHQGSYVEGTATRPGIAFSNLVQRLGGPGGVIEGSVVGRFPEYMQSGVPAGSINTAGTETIAGLQSGPVFTPAGAAAAYTFPQNDYSAWVQLQRGIGGGAHHSHASWFYVRGITFVPLKK